MTAPLIDLSPAELAQALKTHSVTLIDVREPAEYAAEHIHGALLFPLSTFDPAALPMDPAKPVVLNCGVGKRSAMAAAKCAAAGVAINRHLAGGLAAWKSAGLPTAYIDPATGQARDRG